MQKEKFSVLFADYFWAIKEALSGNSFFGIR
jgi:hypothetical protein